MKKVISALLAVVLLFSTIPISTSFATTNGLEFEIVREEEVWVTGYTGNSTVVEIPANLRKFTRCVYPRLRF